MPTSKILGGLFEPLEPPHPTGLIIADYKIDVRVQQTPQISNKMVKELITLEREYVQNWEKVFTGVDRKK